MFAVVYVDQFIVGSVIGPVALGFYVLAFNVSQWPVNIFSRPVRDVSPAAFARLQGDPPALRKAFLSSVGLLTAITLPVCLVVSGAAGPIVKVIYGPEWTQAATALAWLGVLAGLRILFELFYDFFVVLGSSRAVFAVQLAWLVALVPALYVGAQTAGIAGAAAAHVTVAHARGPPDVSARVAPRRDRLATVARPDRRPAAVRHRGGRGGAHGPRAHLARLPRAGRCRRGVVAVLGLSAKRMRATVAQLRTVGSVSLG